MIDVQHYVDMLERAGVTFAPGLSEAEIHQIEASYALRFPPDYRALLMAALPISEGFTDWRNGDRKKILAYLDWPHRGICFDIEHNQFWMRAWGPRPGDLDAAFEIARQAVEQAPRLIPILSHRYIPTAPAESDNPIFSVYQTDIIYYGSNLGEYLENEFSTNLFGQHRYQISKPLKYIPFWSYLVDINNGVVNDGRAD